MHREIKFRVWDKEKQRMIYDGILNPESADSIYLDITLSGCICAQIDDDGNKNGLWEHDIRIENGRLELMQYTGLLDKNGKEIYSGDILKCYDKHWEETICWVDFNLAAAGYVVKDKTCKENEWLTQIYCFDNGMEIIGNIYENPELFSPEPKPDIREK